MLVSQHRQKMFSVSAGKLSFSKTSVFFPVSKTGYGKKPETNINVWFFRKIKCYI